MGKQEISLEEEINFKEFFRVLGHYKWSIIFIFIVVFVLSGFYAYFKTDIYKSTATMKIAATAGATAGGGDIVSKALGGAGNINFEDEFTLMKSRMLAKKALEDLNIGNRYYTIKYYKKVELYKDSPFVVSAEMLDRHFINKTVMLLPLDKSHFRMIVKPTLKEKILYKIYTYFNIPVAPLIYYDKVHTYGKQISSPWFVLTVQKIFDLKNQPYFFSVAPNESMAGFIQDGITAEPLSNFGQTIAVSFEDNVPQRAKDIVDAVIKAYNDEKIRQKTESANKTLSFIDSQLEAIHKLLTKSAKKLETFKSSNVIMDIGTKAGATVTKLSDLEAKIYELNTKIEILNNLLSYIKSNKDLKGIDVSSAQIVGPVITGLITKLQDAVALRSSLLVDYTELHPDVIKVTNQIHQLKSMLVESIKSTLNGLIARKNSLQRILNQEKAKLKALPEKEQRLTQLTRDFMVNEKIYSYLLQKRAETAIIEASKVSEVQLLDPATVPGGPIKPKRSQIIAIGALIGLLLGILQAFVRSKLDNTVKSAEDIERLTNLPVYGVLPDMKSKKMKPAFLEALRVIRTNLEFLAVGKKSKLITVTSSIPKEGKTTTAVELAKIIAKSGKKVIILDLDMRRSRLHELIKLPNKEGVSTLLAGKSTLKEVIQASREENLDVITSGPIPPNPSELLMSEGFKRAISTLRNEYDYILLDSPPIGLVADAMIVMRMSDVNLIVLRADYSKKDFVKNINRFVSEHDLKAGIILNGVKNISRTGAYGYGYGYDYGYKNNYYA